MSRRLSEAMPMESSSDPTTVEPKKLRLRYAGTCVACGAALPQGAPAWYHALSKTVRCVVCREEPAVDDLAVAAPTVAEAAPTDAGIAGGSAQREHDRRAAK